LLAGGEQYEGWEEYLFHDYMFVFGLLCRGG
jgi:hypothetical protein